MPPVILFLDDDPVVRVLRLVLQDEAGDPWVRDYFAPENIDFSALAAAAKGLRRSDGAAIAVATERDADDAQVIIFRRGALTRARLAHYPRLALIQRLGERAVDIDLAAAAERGIRVSCLPRRTLAYTAEHGLLLMLALAKRLLESDRVVRAGSDVTPPSNQPGSVSYNWPAIAASGLQGKTLGIVGMGEVGLLMAKLAHAFGMRILYTKRTRAPADQEAAVGATFVPLDRLLASADFVSLNVTNTPENAAFAGTAFFAGMRPDAFFINTSRGALVDEDALYAALSGGRIAGAGLDVHASEPRQPRDRFARLSNVILTPHLAGGAKGGLLDEFMTIVRNCHAALRGAAIDHEVRA